MTTTTSYGTWTTNVERFTADFGSYVVESLGDFGNDYDIPGLTAAYSAAIQAALPPSVSLCGSEFIGPAYSADCDWNGYPVDTYGDLDIKAIVEGVDFWEIAARHDKTA